MPGNRKLARPWLLVQQTSRVHATLVANEGLLLLLLVLMMVLLLLVVLLLMVLLWRLGPLLAPLLDGQAASWLAGARRRQVEHFLVAACGPSCCSCWGIGCRRGWCCGLYRSRCS